MMKSFLSLFLIVAFVEVHAADLLICFAKPGGESDKQAVSRTGKKRTDCLMMRFSTETATVAWEQKCNARLTASIAVTDDRWVLNAEDNFEDWMLICWTHMEFGKSVGTYKIQGFQPTRNILGTGGQVVQPRNLVNFGNATALLCREFGEKESKLPGSTPGKVYLQAFTSKKILERTELKEASGVEQKFTVAQGWEKPGLLARPRNGAAWKLFSCLLSDDGVPQLTPLLQDQTDLQDAAVIEGGRFLVVCGQNLLTIDGKGAIISKEEISYPGVNRFSAEFIAVTKDGEPVMRLSPIPSSGRSFTILKGRSGVKLLDDQLPATSPVAWRDGKLALIDVRKGDSVLISEKGRAVTKLPANAMIPFSVEIFP